MSTQFTPELIAKARTAESPEALLTLAAEHDVPLTPEEAKANFDLFHQTGELTDEELDNVSGGGCAVYSHGRMIVTLCTHCRNYRVNWACKICGGGSIDGHATSSYDGQRYATVIHYCGTGDVKKEVKGPSMCGGCQHCTHEGALWLCNNPNAYE